MQTRTVSVARWGKRAIVIAGLLTLILASFTGVAWASPSITVDPTSGPGDTQVTVTGSGFSTFHNCPIYMSFTDASGLETQLDTLSAASSFQVQEIIPAGAATGAAKV